MKLYVIIIDDVYDFTGYPVEPKVRLTRKEARRELARVKASARECYQNEYDKMDTTKDSFAYYCDGRWPEYHYDARIEVVDVPLLQVRRPKPRPKKFTLNVVYGEKAARIAAEIGFRAVSGCLARNTLTDGFGHEVDGSAASVRFDTEADRDRAAQLVDDTNGWLGVYWEKD